MIWCKLFDILKGLVVDHKCDRWTDILLANAALNHIVRPKIG